MLRNTRKRLHQFFRPKNALLQFYLQADHKITEGSERAARISHIRTASARCISPARAGPYENGPKPASSFRRSTAPTRNSMRVSREAIFRHRPMRINSRMPRSDPPVPRPRISTPSRTSPNMSGSAQAPAPSLFAFLDDCRSDKSSKVNVWLAISPGSSTTKFSSRCDAAWALKCSPAKVHTGVHRILFPKRRIVQPAGDSVSGGPLVRGARPPHG